MPIHYPQGGGADHQPPVPEGVAHALPAPLEPAQGAGVDALAGDQQVGDLGQPEQAQGDGHDVEAVPQIDLVEGPALDAQDRVGAHGGQQQPGAAGDDALHQRRAAEARHHAHPQHRHHEELRGAEGEHQRAQDGDRQGQHQGAEDAAQGGHREGGAEGAAGLAALGHGVAVDDGGLGAHRAGHGEQHRGDGVRGGGHRQHADDEGEGGDRVHVEGEGEQQRQPGDPADAGDDPEHEAEEGPGEQHEEVHRVEDLEAGLRYGVKHGGCDQ